MILYRNILKNAWETTWKHKYLWFFGLFAALLGNGGELEFIFRGFNGLKEHPFTWLKQMNDTGIFSWQAIVNVGKLLATDPVSMLLIIFTFSLIGIIGGFLVWLTVTSQAAIVDGASKERFKKSHDLKRSLEAGTKNFWPVLGLNFLLKIVTYFLFILISLPIFGSFIGNNLQLSYSIAYLLLFIIFIPISIVLSFIIKYAIAYVVIKGNKLGEALNNGFKIFKANWIVSIEMAFILFFINFLAGLVLLIGFLVLAIPVWFVIVAFAKVTMYINFVFVISTVSIFLIVIFAFAGSIISTFQISAWTNLFIGLEGKGGISKINRLFGKSRQ